MDPSEPSAPPREQADGRVFQFRCRRCASILEARAGQSGQSARCPTCDAVFVVPPVDPRTGLAAGDADPGDDGENPTPVHAYAAAGDKAPRIVRKPDDSLVIVCPRCEFEGEVTLNNCPRCGLPFTLEGANTRVATGSSGGSHTPLVLGILALVFSVSCFVGPVLGMVAIAISLSDRSSDPASWGLSSKVGLGLGVIACLIFLGSILQWY